MGKREHNKEETVRDMIIINNSNESIEKIKNLNTCFECFDHNKEESKRKGSRKMEKMDDANV